MKVALIIGIVFCLCGMAYCFYILIHKAMEKDLDEQSKKQLEAIKATIMFYVVKYAVIWIVTAVCGITMWITEIVYDYKEYITYMIAGFAIVLILACYWARSYYLNKGKK